MYQLCTLYKQRACVHRLGKEITKIESKGKLPYEIPSVEVLLVGDYIYADVINSSNNIDKEGSEDASDFFG